MLRTVFSARPLTWAAVFILLQQTIVAASTWFLSQVTVRVADPKALFPWLLGFLICLSLPYLPGAFAVRCMGQLKNIAQGRILDLLRTAIEGRATLLAHAGERERRFVFLQREGEDFVTHACDGGFDFSQTLVNIVLNIAALVAVVHPALLPTYALSLALLLLSTRLSREPLTRATRAQREARIGFEDVRLKTWENLTIGNTLNTQRWNASLTNQYKNFACQRLRLTSLRECASLLSTWAAMVPVLAANLWMVWSAQSGTQVALIVATLPRQLMVLNHIHILSSYSGFWHEMRERWAGLEAAVSTVDPNLRAQHDNRIRFTDLTVEPVVDETLDSTEACVRWIQKTQHGRYRVHGSNGAGKSTLLRSIKESLACTAIYLPAEHAALDFPVAAGLSSGQRARAILEVLRTSAPRVVLLDEWDANLDAHHRGVLDTLVAQLAERHLVLEVRHH